MKDKLLFLMLCIMSAFGGNNLRAEEAPDADYQRALETIKDGSTYRVIAEYGNGTYYLKADGYLTDLKYDAHLFTFKKDGNGTLKSSGWNLGCKFTNPNLTNQASGDIVKEGHIRVGGNDRSDWERQVFFLNDAGKYAIRATNSNSDSWGASTYWDVFDGEPLPEADYSLEPAYIWNLEEIADPALEGVLNTLKAIIAQGNEIAKGLGYEYIEALNNINVEDIKTIEEANQAIADAKQAIIDYIADIQSTDAVNITALISNPTPIENIDGWEGIGIEPKGSVAEYWNKSGASFHQTITLPAGEYVLSVSALTRTDMKGYVYAGNTQTPIKTVGSDLINSTGTAANAFAADAYMNRVYFTLDETREIEIGLVADNTTSDYWTVWQSFKLEKVASIALVKDPYTYKDTYKDVAFNAQLILGKRDPKYYVGTALFQTPTPVYDALRDAIEQEVDETDIQALQNATTAINEAVDAFKNTVNVPEEGATYALRQKVSGLFLAVDPTIAEHATNGGQVFISATGQAFTWTEVEGGYKLSNQDGSTIGMMSGSNGWAMSVTHNLDLTISPTLVIVDEKIYYTLNEKNGMIATDDTVEKSYCYADKNYTKSGDKIYWTIEKVMPITLDETSDMASNIADNDNKVCDVTLNRSIKEGYNTVVLPFALSAEQVEEVFGEGATVYAYSEESEDANQVTVSFNSTESGIAANVPVLVKATEASSSNTIAGATIAYAESPVAEGTNVNFVGVYNATTVVEGDYFISDGKLYKSAGETSIKPFRAYLDATSAGAEVKLFIDGTATSIESINGAAEAEDGAIYNLAGQRVGKAQKGIYIVNGKKVIVK